MTPIGEMPFEDNVPGKFYIDKSCINCGLCPTLAPHTFADAEDGTHSYAVSQPTNDDEIGDCAEAVSLCPSKSVRDDGDEIFGMKA